MRQWMVDPRILCRKHLLGEHVEMHMFVGSIHKELSMDGYVKNNLMQPLALRSRHDALVEEMTRRGMNHKSPLPEFSIDYLPAKQKVATVDVDSALADLLNRCPECQARYDAIQNGEDPDEV